MSKEATVERNRMPACSACGSTEWHARGSRMCQAELDRKALERAWDEGYAACIYDPIHGPKSRNPYRQPPKGDGDGE